ERRHTRPSRGRRRDELAARMTRVTVVTGAGGAMGNACARALATTTDVLLCTDIDEQRLKTAAAELARTVDTNVCVAPGDLSDPAFVHDLADRTHALGTLHALVNTAGLSPSMAGWQEILRVDLVAAARLLEVFEPLAETGSVAVHIASVSGHMGGFDPEM